MALDDDATIVAAVGYVYTNSVGFASPTPSDITAFDPETFGCASKLAKVTGAPTSYTLTVGAATSSSLAPAATAPQVQAALEALSTVGVGNVSVTGVSIVDTAGLTITWIESLAGSAPVMTATFVAGTTPALAYTTVTAANGWSQIGHTSRGKLPEFGYTGGKQEMKGTWQRRNLREVQTGDPIADSVKMVLEQWDANTLELYYGVDSANTPGIFGVDGKFNPVEKALLVVIVDGDNNVGFYAPKASIQRDDGVTLPIDDFAGLPIEATFLNLKERRLFDWISESLFA